MLEELEEDVEQVKKMTKWKWNKMEISVKK